MDAASAFEKSTDPSLNCEGSAKIYSLSRSGLHSNFLSLAARPHLVQTWLALHTNCLYRTKSDFSSFFISHSVFDMIGKPRSLNRFSVIRRLEPVMLSTNPFSRFNLGVVDLSKCPGEISSKIHHLQPHLYPDRALEFTGNFAAASRARSTPHTSIDIVRKATD